MRGNNDYFRRMTSGVLFLFILIGYKAFEARAQDVCEKMDIRDKPENGCLIRQELTLFATNLFLYGADCNNTYCLCKKYPIKVLYYNHPPYIYFDKNANQTIGIFTGM